VGCDNDDGEDDDSLKGTAYCLPKQQQQQRGVPSSSLYKYWDHGVDICQGGERGGGNYNNRNKQSLPLVPISEECQVKFAGQHIVSRVRGSERTIHYVLDAIQVWLIPPITEYNEEERNSMWYTQDGMYAMRPDFSIKRRHANDRKQQRQLLFAAKKMGKKQPKNRCVNSFHCLQQVQSKGRMQDFHFILMQRLAQLMLVRTRTMKKYYHRIRVTMIVVGI
jgi:hypothetical protein